MTDFKQLKNCPTVGSAVNKRAQKSQNTRLKLDSFLNDYF